MIQALAAFLIGLQDGLPEAEFEKLHRQLQPPADELWRTVPWKTSILEARALGAREKKPLVMRVRSGHPLGCVWNNGIIDRVSILSNAEIVEALKTKFVPVAVDQHDHRRRKDAEGELFAKILTQAGRDLEGTSQGFYLFSPAGKLLAFENTLSADRMKRMLDSALAKYDPKEEVPAIEAGPKDERFLYEPPAQGLVVTVTSRVLSGYGEPKGKDQAATQAALGLDHLWVRKDEAEALAKGDLPESLKTRIARYHLIDNTRGEPPFWRAEDLRKVDLTLKDGRLTGTVHLENSKGDRGFRAQVLGLVEVKEDTVTRFDVVARGDFWGEGTYTRGAPKGKFPFAVAFTLAGGKDEIDHAPPGGARGNLKAYLR